MSPEKVQEILKKNGLSPNKVLGQNFLCDDKDLAAIAEVAELNRQDKVVELGAGTGNLTEKILASNATVIALEKDEKLAQILSKRFGEKRLVVWEGNMLNFDFNLVGQTFKVLGNIPYYLTGAILRKLIELKNPPQKIVLTVQKEVAERLVAKPPKASFVSLVIQMFGTARIVRIIPRGHFWPEPKVDSVVVVIEYDPTKKINKELVLFMRKGFRQPRKTILNNLVSAGYSKGELERVIKNSGRPPTVRAHELTAYDWQSLYQKIKSHQARPQY